MMIPKLVEGGVGRWVGRFFGGSHGFLGEQMGSLTEYEGGGRGGGRNKILAANEGRSLEYCKDSGGQLYFSVTQKIL